jgi:hypothetical protein
MSCAVLYLRTSPSQAPAPRGTPVPPGRPTPQSCRASPGSSPWVVQVRAPAALLAPTGLPLGCPQRLAVELVQRGGTATRPVPRPVRVQDRVPRAMLAPLAPRRPLLPFVPPERIPLTERVRVPAVLRGCTGPPSVWIAQCARDRVRPGTRALPDPPAPRLCCVAPASTLSLALPAAALVPVASTVPRRGLTPPPARGRVRQAATAPLAPSTPPRCPVQRASSARVVQRHARRAPLVCSALCLGWCRVRAAGHVRQVGSGTSLAR